MQPAGSTNQILVRSLLAAALGLWLLCLVLPAVEARGGPAFSGYEVLLRGWSAWRNGVFAWYANPLLILAVLSGWLGRGRLAAVSALSGAALAVTSFWSADIARAGGMGIPELSFRAGFYCWIAAHMAAVVGGIFSFIRRKSVQRI